MGATYRITVNNATDIAAKIAQISSEQATLLTKLGVSVTSDSGVKFSRTDSDNEFDLIATPANGIKLYEGITQINTTTSYDTYYLDVHCVANSIMLVLGHDSVLADATTPCCAIITCNADGDVIVICNSTYSSSNPYYNFYVKDSMFGSAAATPMIKFANCGCQNFNQFSLSNIPMSEPGKYCENAFTIRTYNQSIVSSLVVMNGVEYACFMGGTSESEYNASAFFMCK